MLIEQHATRTPPTGRMSELLPRLSDLSVQVFAIASMASVGLRYTLREILAPLRDLWAVALALVANFAAVPMLAFLILQAIELDTPYAIGLDLAASAAGAPMIVKLTQLSGGNVAFSAGLLVLLIVVSIAYMPFVVPLLAPRSEISAWAIAGPLVMTMLLPLATGLLVRHLAPRASGILPLLGLVTNISLALLVMLTFAINLPTVAGMVGTGAILASLLFIAGAFAIGWLFGGAFGEKLRDEMALATSQRNFAAALVVATESFEAPGVLVMVVAVSLVTMAVLFPAAKLLNRRAHRQSVVA
jgi:bile acid:Na+ symporter, BASS family